MVSSEHGLPLIACQDRGRQAAPGQPGDKTLEGADRAMTPERSKRWSKSMKKPVFLLLVLLAGFALSGCVGEIDLIDDSAVDSVLVDA